MIRPRALRWVAWFLYLSVLLAGLAGTVTDGGSWPRFACFAAGLGVAAALEVPALPRTRPGAVAALAMRAALFTLLVALDGAGIARVLFVLLPLTAYFTVGRRTAFWLGGAEVAGVALLVAGRPDAEAVSDVAMFAVGTVFALVLAVLAGREEAGRRRAEELLAELAEAHERLREYADRAVSLATVAERTRLARDIHDTVGHHLVVTAIQLEKAAAFRDLEPATADRALADSRDSTRAALREVRHAVAALRADGSEFELAGALRALAARLHDPGFAVTLELSADGAALGETTALTLYLVAQEALTNARRHAAATTVTIRADLDAGAIDIRDDGAGFAPGTVEGNGLRGMRERLACVGGALTVTSGPGGTRLLAEVPRR
ncbi:sensor histidine kinase [Nocardia sp. NPDC057227]|uniref:sensor histidine kinase n=1 Tax=Nocardia sp. NPDC057227 TaxID=3346056 RepID=UPI0036368844